VRKSSSNWLVNVQKVWEGVPWVWITVQGLSVWVEAIWTILVEESDLRSASRASSEPKNKWIWFSVISGLKPPIEDIIFGSITELTMSELTVINSDEAWIPGLVYKWALILERRAVGVSSDSFHERRGKRSD
jgi:hypothetical protein